MSTKRKDESKIPGGDPVPETKDPSPRKEKPARTASPKKRTRKQPELEQNRVEVMTGILDLVRQVFPRTFTKEESKEVMQWASVIKILVEALMKLHVGPGETGPTGQTGTDECETAESLQEWIREKEKDLGFRIVEDEKS